MRIKFYLTVLTVSLLASSLQISAQGTFTQVHQILQANCGSSSCHGNLATNPSFNVDATESALYNKLVNGTPVNPNVKAGDKLVMPGYVDRSLLLRKIVHGLNENNSHMALGALEGVNMPDAYPFTLQKHEIELIRQWILFGAPLSGTVVDTSIINRYYREGGINDTYTPHDAPAPGTGFQMYVGKIFVVPHTEQYYYIKHKPEYTGSIEVPRIVGLFPQSAHHMVVYKFFPGGENNYREGLRPESETSHADVLDGIGMTKGYCEYQLPPNTAYFWGANSTLDFNLHIKNTSDSILATDLFINVYTQPVGTAQHPMFVRNFPVFTISIPQNPTPLDTTTYSFNEVANDTNETHMWKIWQLYSHTHKYGTDYDIFLRNSDGSAGNKEYEGWLSYEQGGINIGYYRFGVDVTFKYYPDDSLLEVDPRLGFVHRATFKNTAGPNPILWGLTSDEEMMVMGFQYIEGDLLTPLSAPDLNKENVKVNVFPNPASDVIRLNYTLYQPSDVKVELTNVLGETVSVLEQKNKPTGNYLDEIDLNNKYAPGMYVLTFKAGNASTTKRMVIE